MKVTRTLRGIRFEWDSDKAYINIRKHDTSFEIACEIFFDPFFQQGEEEIVKGELRESIIGMTESWQLLKVVYTFRDDAVRLISTRPVTQQERRNYEDQ